MRNLLARFLRGWADGRRNAGPLLGDEPRRRGGDPQRPANPRGR